MSWDVVIHPDATTELDALAPSEQASVLHAIEKLIALGPLLAFPHQSHVEGERSIASWKGHS